MYSHVSKFRCLLHSCGELCNYLFLPPSSLHPYLAQGNTEYIGGIKSACCKTNFGSILGMCQRNDVAIAPHDGSDKAMKGMLMKAIKAAQGEHLPQGLTFFRPLWYSSFFFYSHWSLSFSHLLSFQVQRIIVKIIFALFFHLQCQKCLLWPHIVSSNMNMKEYK